MTGRNWTPQSGHPKTKAEEMMHSLIKALASLPVYTAFVVTLTLVAVVVQYWIGN